MSVKENAVVTVSYENGGLVLSDNEGNPFNPSDPAAFTTNVEPNGKIGWQVGTGISSISLIKIDTGEDIFKKLPSEKKGVWEATLDRKQSGESKYSIIYTVDGSTTPITLDPKLKITPPPPPPAG